MHALLREVYSYAESHHYKPGRASQITKTPLVVTEFSRALSRAFLLVLLARQTKERRRERERACKLASFHLVSPPNSVRRAPRFKRGARVRSFTSLVFRISFGLTIQLLTWVQQLRTPLFPRLLSHGEVTISPCKPLTNQGERVSPLFHSARP